MDPMDTRERRILVVTCLGHFLSHCNMLVFPAVVLPISHRLGLGMAEVLGFSFWMYVLFGVSALPWGILADRIGSGRLLTVFYLGAGVSSLAAAFWLEDPSRLSLSLAALGLFSGIYHPTGLGLISMGIRRMSLALGYNGMFGNLGLALAPLLAGVVNWLWGPRAVYGVLGVLNLIGVGLMIVMELDTSRVEVKHRGEEEQGGLLTPFIILLVAMMLGGVAYRGATVVLPSYFELNTPRILEALRGLLGEGLSANLVATSTASCIYLVGILGQYAGGRVAERLEARRAYLVFHAITVPAAFFMGMVRDLPLAFLGVGYFFFLLGMQPIENTLVARFSPPRFRHAAFGTKFVLVFGVGALSVRLVGAVEKAWGLDAVFPVLAGVSLSLVVVVLFLMSRTGPVRPISS